ncbi:DUF2157 domain-containing protein [Alteromonas facilis]|uniref:DUF2157 domain-containing protein n=1 Tax=Alteromonas facilis TaxID=2048004 RepID=UPI000C294A67|nr:DUF2157 domain-containing protein [Alteromonas facilis]
MRVNKASLQNAVDKGIISLEQAQALETLWQESPATGPRFSTTHVLYYFGGLVAIGAMSIFMNLGWETFGGAGISILSLIYMSAGILLSKHFVSKHLHTPAGITAAFSVCVTPLLIYGIQHWLGFWPDETTYTEYHRHIQWHWLYMELGTLAVGATLLWRYKFPFIMLPIALTLWYMSMDVAVMLSSGESDWELRRLVSLYSGLIMIVFAVWIDLRTRQTHDYAFWLYLGGAFAFWGGLTLLDSGSQWSRLAYCGINILMIAFGIALTRKVFVILGGIGVFIYLAHLASVVFKDSWLFPIALSILGLAIIYLGIIWQRHEQRLSTQLQQKLPDKIRTLFFPRQ